MLQKVQYHIVRKGQIVNLARQLPLGFGNKNPIIEGAKGYITSEGFESGILKVEFYSHYNGTENVQFNPDSALKYLITDIY